MSTATSTALSPNGIDTLGLDSPTRAIVCTCERIAALWSASDAANLALAWAADGDHMTLTRVKRIRRGRGEIADGFRHVFAGRTAGFSRRIRITIASMRFVKSDVAVLDGNIEYSAGVGAGGRREPAMTESFTWVMTLHGHEWLITASRVGPTIPREKIIDMLSQSTRTDW